MRDLADHEFVRLNIRSLHLHMALEAEIIVPFGKKLPVDRAVWIVAGDATVAQRFMLKNERAALFAMTLRAALVEPRHREPARRLHNVVTVGIMALDAVHDSFNDGMMLREFELGMDVQVALKTGARIFAGIHDEPAAPADADMLAGRAVAGFAAGNGSELDVIPAESSVRAGRERARDIRVAIHTGGVPDVMRACDRGRRIDCLFESAARGKKAHR